MADNNDVTPASKTGSVLNILAGIWLIIAAYILAFAAVRNATENSIIVGVLVIIFALVGLSNARILWSRWINILLGIWMFFAPFILGYAASGRALWNSIILGILIIIFAAWSASAVSHYHHPEPR